MTRSFGPLGFTWGNLALTQAENLIILQLIEFAGTYSISFIIIASIQSFSSND